MGAISVNDIIVTNLKRIPLDGGDVLHAMKASDPGYVGFGESYFSMIEYRAVKAWKRHLRMTLNFIVPVGAVKFAFIDENHAVREEVIGVDRFARLTIPPGVWFGFQGLSYQLNLLNNIADIEHDPTEIERKSVGEIKFDWEL